MPPEETQVAVRRPRKRRRLLKAGLFIGGATAATAGAFFGGKALLKKLKGLLDVGGRASRGVTSSAQSLGALGIGQRIGGRALRGSPLKRTFFNTIIAVSKPAVGLQGFLKGFF